MSYHKPPTSSAKIEITEGVCSSTDAELAGSLVVEPSCAAGSEWRGEGLYPAGG